MGLVSGTAAGVDSLLSGSHQRHQVIREGTEAGPIGHADVISPLVGLLFLS